MDSSSHQNDPLHLASVLNRVQQHVYSSRIRISEFFKDYDKLRSGFITHMQFKRCLALCLDKGPQLSSADMQELCTSFDSMHDGTVNYNLFVNSIDRVNLPSNVGKDQAPNIIKPDPKPGTSIDTKKTELVQRIIAYIRQHGSDVRDWYASFDKHNNGLVSVNQFERGFPSNLANTDEIILLATIFKDLNTHHVNYKKMNTLINRQVKTVSPIETTDILPIKSRTGRSHVPIGTEIVLEKSDFGNSNLELNSIMNMIKQYVYVNRIRVVDLMKDYDRHRHGLITKPQFVAALKANSLILSTKQMDVIVNAYLHSDNVRVAYKNFCRDVDEIFTTHKVESDPTVVVEPPTPDQLIMHGNKVSPEDEAIFENFTKRMNRQLEERRIDFASFFRDFDNRVGRTDQITKSQFARLLSLAGIEVSEQELYAIFAKCQDPYHNHFLNINGHQKDLARKTKRLLQAIESRSTVVPDIETLLNEIHSQGRQKQIRVSEFLRDYDRSRNGYVARHDFIRALNLMGFGFNAVEYDLVADHYKEAEQPDQCNWRQFETFMANNNVLSQSHATDSCMDSSEIIRPEGMTNTEIQVLNSALKAIRAHIGRRNISMETHFYSFDKLRTGRVSQTQLRQILSWVGVEVTDMEYQLILRSWNRHLEFKYRPFLRALLTTPTAMTPVTNHASEPKKEQYATMSGNYAKSIRAAGTKLHNGCGGGLVAMSGQQPATPLELISTHELEAVILRIKCKIKSERIRVLDAFIDFDRRRRGFISKIRFERALDRFNFQLNCNELATLASKYLVQDDMGTSVVDYRKFCSDMEVFTVNNLEQTPTAEIQDFRPIWHEHGTKEQTRKSGGLVVASSSCMNEALTLLMHNIAEDLRRKRMFVLLRYLEDPDKIHNGTITREKFHSAMMAAGCSLTDSDVDLIVSGYSLADHDDHIDYLAFNDDLMAMSKKIWNDNSVSCVKDAVYRQVLASARQPRENLAVV